jgi:hypothetical protein
MNRNQVNLFEWLGTSSVRGFKSVDEIRKYFRSEDLLALFGAKANIANREAAMSECLREWNEWQNEKAKTSRRT